MKMTGNTMLITGGTSGIGRALAEQFHARGNKVIITGRRRALLDEITNANPGMEALEVDVADDASLGRFTQEVKQRYPQLNVLINNAGILNREDYTQDTIDQKAMLSQVQVNITSFLRVAAELLPLLRAQPEAALIAPSSGLAYTPGPPYPVYCATKAFVHTWLEATRFQLRNTGVEVIEMVPPYVQTGLEGEHQMSDPNAMPLNEFIDETLAILEQGKLEGGQVLVKRVLPLRFSERDGHYQQLMERLGSH